MDMLDKPLIAEAERRKGKCQSVLNCLPGETTEEAYARILKEESEHKSNDLPKRVHSHHGTVHHKPKKF